MTIASDLMERRKAVLAEAEQIAQRGVQFGRDLSANEQTRFDELIAEAEKIKQRAAEIEAGEHRASDFDESFRKATGRDPQQAEALGRHPLAVDQACVDGLQEALTTRSSGQWLGVEERAALTTGTYGAPRVWASNALPAPRLLHVAAGVFQQPSDAPFAQVPSFTLPTAGSSVAENASLAEYSSVTAGNVTLARYGRWTDLSVESMVGTSSAGLLGMHRLGIALDLDKALITAASTAAGTAITFAADVPGQIRKAIATVQANTGVDDVGSVMIVANPADVNLIETVQATGGSTIGEAFPKFAGATVYASTAQTAGFMLVGVFSVGVRYFEARQLTVESLLAPKNGTMTVASHVIAGYGLNVVTGWVVSQDVVTP